MYTDRYKKNILIEGFGDGGQEKLAASRVAVIGLGGLGSVVSLYLAAAGAGKLIIVDEDTLSMQDLQRQVIYDEESVGRSKTDAATDKLKKLNSNIEIIVFNSQWQEIKDELLKEKPDIIIDCVDNNKTKFNINDFAVKNKIALVHAGVVGMRGQVTSIIPGQTGCLRCLFPDSIPEDISSDTDGIMGPVAGNIGTMQAIEAIKYLSGLGECLKDKILFIDYRKNKYEIFECERAEGCICSK